MTDEGGDAACWLDQVCESCGALVVAGDHACSRVSPVARVIIGFHQDEVGDWVAHLSCGHAQHVRHQPPFQQRPWVTTSEARAAHIGAEIPCPQCARAELPEGLTVVRTAGPFHAATVPRGLLRNHVVADRTWGRVQVIEGTVTFSMQTDPPTVVRLGPGDSQAIPPSLPHALTLEGPVVLTVDFLTVAE